MGDAPLALCPLSRPPGPTAAAPRCDVARHLRRASLVIETGSPHGAGQLWAEDNAAPT
jgi:hypothetical protein